LSRRTPGKPHTLTPTYLPNYLNTHTYRLGLPGCVGSMDCTHVGWHKCPKEWTNIMTGASGKPTLSFQVLVDHNRKVTHCSKWFYGTWNNKMITVQVSQYCLFQISFLIINISTYYTPT
jgi:hypothetical protein